MPPDPPTFATYGDQILSYNHDNDDVIINGLLANNVYCDLEMVVIYV